ESCNIVDQVINTDYSCRLNFIDDKIIKRKEELIKQAKWIVNLIPDLARTPFEQENPFINYKVLNRLIKYGIFDAPHLKNNEFALGRIKTKTIKGACYSWDEECQEKVDELSRIKKIIEENLDRFKSDDGIQKEINRGGVMPE
ncbi:MAG: hypothetical protein GY870_07580, partial [archaeon]|nr:hypothetical protein [archaeon]